MTKEELIKRRWDLFLDFHSKYETLGEVYADERCPVKVGDIIRGTGCYLKVEKIDYSGTGYALGIGEVPYCSFFGTVVKKDGTPYKSNTKMVVSPWALKEVNGKKVKYDYKS